MLTVTFQQSGMTYVDSKDDCLSCMEFFEFARSPATFIDHSDNKFYGFPCRYCCDQANKEEYAANDD